jgi:hypothetical protein
MRIARSCVFYGCWLANIPYEDVGVCKHYSGAADAEACLFGSGGIQCPDQARPDVP